MRDGLQAFCELTCSFFNNELYHNYVQLKEENNGLKRKNKKAVKAHKTIKIEQPTAIARAYQQTKQSPRYGETT